jgi:hypothetical protein
VAGEEDQQIGINLPVDLFGMNKAFLHIVEFVGASGILPRFCLIGIQQQTYMVPDIYACLVLTGVDERNLHEEMFAVLHD